MQTQGQRRRKLKLMLLVMTLCCVTALYIQQAHLRRRYPYRYRLPLPYRRRIRPFSLRRRHPEWVRQFLRFSVDEFLTLLPLLRLDGVEYRACVKPSPECALAVVLYRLSYPRRLADCCEVFGRSRAWISQVFNAVTVYLDKQFQSILEWHLQLQNYNRLQAFGQAVLACGGQGNGLIWGFIDGTFIAFCRSIDNEHQCRMYSGYYKDHRMKWQAIVTPDGIISSLCGPYPGPANDWTMLHDSGVLDKCRTVYSDHQRLYIYSDPAYSDAFGIMGPYQHPGGRHALPCDEYEFNVALSSVRISVEHAFGHVIKQWGFISFSKGLSEGLSPVAAYFTTAVLFTNCLTCFRGSQTSERFSVEPLSISEYLQYVYNSLPLSN
jgi:hypothetical protein